MSWRYDMHIHILSFHSATSSTARDIVQHTVPKKNPHAVALGRLGGKKRAEVLSREELQEISRKAGESGGRARAEKLSKERRREIARKAAAARWNPTRKRAPGKDDK
jgi:general stress protein YciG